MYIRRRKLLALATAVGATSLLGHGVRTAEASSHGWPHPRFDDANTAYATRDAPTGDFNEVWTKQGGTVSTPVVADGTVYAAEGTTLLAADSEDGSTLWKFTADGSIEDTPTVVDGTVYITGGAETYAIDAETGDEDWSHRGRGGTSASPKVRVDERTGGGRVYVAKDTSVYALGRSTGRQIWNTDVGGQVGGSPALSGGRLYVSSSDGNLYAIERENGRLDWREEVGNSIETPPVVEGDSVFVVDSLGRAASFESDRGERWSNRLNASVTSPPAVDDDHLYVPTDDGSLHAIRTSSSGFEEWVFETEEGALTAPTVSGDHVYVGAGGTLYVLEASNGNVVTEYDAASIGPVAVADGTLYYGRNALQAVEGGTQGPEIRIARASLETTTVSVGSQVTASATLVNSGNEAGSVELRLDVDGGVVGTERFDVSAGSQRDVTLSHSFETAGEYSMSVNDESLGTVTVTEGSDDESEVDDSETDDTSSADGNESDGGTGNETEDGGEGGDDEPRGIKIPLDGFGVGVASAAAVLTATVVKLVSDDHNDED